MENEEKFYGFVVYEIVKDGLLEGQLLNGSFVNNDINNEGRTMNEIARRRSPICDDGISGEYTDAYIEFYIDKKGSLTTLKITPNGNFTYSLEWEDTGIIGTGMKIGVKQFVAFYWKKDDPICFSENIK